MASLKSKASSIVITIALCSIIAGQALYLYQQHSDLEILRSKYSFLQEDFETLQENYDALKQRCTSLESKYSSLREDYETLQQDYETVYSEFSALYSVYKTLESQLAEVDGTISNLRLQQEILRQIVEENKFMFYYASLAKQRYGVDGLEEYLDRWQWSEGAYTEDVFDCSEMSAYLEWRLENEGYHTIIAVGEKPSGKGYHAWLLVETSAGHYMPVEATTYDLVTWEDQSFHKYFIYDHIFETIQDALEYSYEEFDWWKS